MSRLKETICRNICVIIFTKRNIFLIPIVTMIHCSFSRENIGYSLLAFFGLVPLWGVGVISVTDTISSPPAITPFTASYKEDRALNNIIDDTEKLMLSKNTLGQSAMSWKQPSG